MFMIFIELLEFIHWGGIGKWFEFQDWERKFYVILFYETGIYQTIILSL